MWSSLSDRVSSEACLDNCASAICHSLFHCDYANDAETLVAEGERIPVDVVEVASLTRQMMQCRSSLDFVLVVVVD